MTTPEERAATRRYLKTLQDAGFESAPLEFAPVLRLLEEVDALERQIALMEAGHSVDLAVIEGAGAVYVASLSGSRDLRDDDGKRVWRRTKAEAWQAIADYVAAQEAGR